jgi:8-oxo-dGTP pyrophosphatase MutT (NUDIX family)
MTRITWYQGVIIRDHRILLIKQTEHATGRSYWLIPGGRIEPDETAEKCVEREMLEETGLHVQVEYLLLDEPSLSYRRSGVSQDRGGATRWFLGRAGCG